MKISKIVLGMFVGSLAISHVAFASQSYYGLPKATAAKQTRDVERRDSQVVLHNYTNDTYSAYATFQSTGQTSYLFIDAAGTPRSTVTYQINYPDYSVCLNVIRNFDGAQVYNNCLYTGNVNLGPYRFRREPVVNVTH